MYGWRELQIIECKLHAHYKFSTQICREDLVLQNTSDLGQYTTQMKTAMFSNSCKCCHYGLACVYLQIYYHASTTYNLKTSLDDVTMSLFKFSLSCKASASSDVYLILFCQ